MGTCQFPSVGTGTLSDICLQLRNPWMKLKGCLSSANPTAWPVTRYCVAIPGTSDLSWSGTGVAEWIVSMRSAGLTFFEVSIRPDWMMNGVLASLTASWILCYSHLIRFDLEEVFPVSKSTPCHDMSLPWTRATVPFGATELRCLQRPTSPGARSAALCTVSLPALPMSCPKSSGSCGRCSRDVSDVRGSVACWKMAEDDEPSPSIGL